MDVSASGGTPPYTYFLSGPVQKNSTVGSITGLPAGTYTVTVMDSRACQSTASGSLSILSPPLLESSSLNINVYVPVTTHMTQPDVLTIDTTYTIPPCDSPSGTISATAGGGTPQYSFSINGNVSSTGSFGGLHQGMLFYSFFFKFCFVLFCFVLFCFVLFCFILFYFILFYFIFYFYFYFILFLFTLAIGNYTVIATDANSCTAQQTVVVKLYSNDIQALAYSHPVRCYGYLFLSLSLSLLLFSLPPLLVILL